MAVYAISDIHGALDELKALLKKIHLSYTGEDTLYFLGDYGDWGKKSMETILFIREMEDTYDFVHCLMGNHEQMFLHMIESGKKHASESEIASNWLIDNRGQRTWDAYMEMDAGTQHDLASWLHSLPLSASIRCGDRVYMLGHAYPYFYDQASTFEEAEGNRFQALWRRLELHEDPFAAYHGQISYDCFVCGHTIADVYARRLAEEQGTTVRGSMNRIFFGERFIDIDCGAKCFDLMEEKPAAAARSCLAALRLDDLAETYVVPAGREEPGEQP